jgi:hypothetical protein
MFLLMDFPQEGTLQIVLSIKSDNNFVDSEEIGKL